MSEAAQAIQPNQESRRSARDQVKPKDRLVGPNYLCEGLGIHRTTLWRRQREGLIPDFNRRLGRPSMTQERADEIIRANG